MSVTMKRTHLQSKNVAIIGAGIIGVACALQLQSAGFNVTLVDKSGVSEGCSKGNAGHFASEQVFPLADKQLLKTLPAMLMHADSPVSIHLPYFLKLVPWLCRFFYNMAAARFDKNTAALKSLNRYAISEFKELLEKVNLSHFMITKGSLLVFESTPLPVIVALKDQYQKEGVAVSLLTYEEVKEIEPELEGIFTHALYFTDVAHTFDPEGLCVAMFKAFARMGGHFRKLTVEKIAQHENKVIVKTQRQEYLFDKVVIATGAWSKPLAMSLGYRVPLDTERGYHVMLKQPFQLRRPIASFERKIIVTPMKDKVRVAGTVEFAGLKRKENPKRFNILAYHAAKLLNREALNAPSISQGWLGMRPSLPDSLPVIGQAPFHSAIFFAFGHQHLGLTQAAITARLIKELVSNEATCLDISPFSISRFQ